MVYTPLKNGSGQVVKDIKLESPDGKQYKVISSSRKGINRYEMVIEANDGSTTTVMNHELRNKWSIVGDWHSPEHMAEMFDRKVDPDANKPRPMRESFWKMKSRKGSHNYKQKLRLMKKPEYSIFKEYFETTIER